MATIPFHLLNGYSESSPVSAKDLDRRANVTKAQLGGLLKIIGAGVSYADPYGVNSLQVSISGGTITVSNGAGFVADSIGNVYAFEITTPQTVAGLGSDPYYIHAQFITPDADVADPDIAATDDTENTGKVLLVADTSDTLPEAVLLASISGGVVTDERVPVRWDNVAAQLAEIILWLGYDGTVYSGSGDVNTRLDNIEGVGGSVVSLLSQLAINPTDPRNAAAVLLDLESRLAIVENGGSNIKPMQQLIDILTQELAMTRQNTIALQPNVQERSASSNIEGTVAGVTGDGSDGRTDYLIDTTMTINVDGELEA